ncbi:MAG: hypothetical protein J4400_03315 [Candidatus Aenigmarchaeota archaeon]|nr:hypothetical protein [Candidatus Aenigmarchaeota archaeon]
MANIWTNRQRTIDDPTDYRVHPLNLVTIAGSHDYYAIDGVNMALKGSDAWRAYIEKHRALLRKNTSASESAKEELISELSFSAALPVNETSFQALGCGRSRRMRLLLDKEEDTTCEVFPQHRQTHVFTQGYRQHENYLGDAAQKFKHGFGIGEAVYDGTLSDALREFEQAGYEFIFYDGVWCPDYFDGGGNPAKTQGNAYQQSELTLIEILDRLNNSTV